MLWFILILALILIWAIPAFRTLQEMDGRSAPLWRIPFLHLIDEPEEAAVVFVLLGISIAVGGYAFLYGLGTLRDMVGDFYANIAAEAISIAITVLIIERLYERRSKTEAERAEKERLILQLGSPDNTIAIEAVRQLRQHGWLSDGSLYRSSLSGANLSQASLYGAKLDRSFLTGTDLSKAVLDSASLYQANLSGANLVNARLFQANLKEANLWKANLREANLWGANLNEAFLENANLYKTNLLNANLSKAKLSEANMSKALLVGTNLSEADMTNTNLDDVMLWVVNLTGTNLSNVNLSSTRYTEGTQWPNGFSPQAAGAIKVEWNEKLRKWIPVDAS